MTAGKFSKIRFGDGLAVTDEGGGVITVSGGGGGGVTQLAYVEFTSAVSVTATSETPGSQTTVVSAGALTFDGSTRICVEFFSPYARAGSTAGSTLRCNLIDGSTDLGRMCLIEEAAAAVNGRPIMLRRFLTPTAGSHTYIWKAHRTTSDGSVGAGAGGAATQMPGYIRITSGG